MWLWSEIILFRNCLLLQLSAPCDYSQLDQFNKLTDTNFHYCQHCRTNVAAKDQAVFLLCFMYQQNCHLSFDSGLFIVGVGWRGSTTNGEKVTE